jgi:hypothetical protein
LGAIDQLLGGFVIGHDRQKWRNYLKNVNVWTISRQTGAGQVDSMKISVNCPEGANNRR